MTKSRAFTLAACGLGGLFLFLWLWAGAKSGWFGFEDLWRREEPSWQFSYASTWDPAEGSFRGLSIDWGHGPVEVRLTEGPLVTVTEYSPVTLEAGEKLRLSSSRGVLRIQWDEKPLSLGSLLPGEKRLVVELPAGAAEGLQEFSCQNRSGDVTVSGIGAKALKVASGSGDLLLEDLSGEAVEVGSASGGVRWQGGSAQELTLKMGSGPAELVGIQAEDCRLKTVSGPVEYQGAGARVQVESVSGPVGMVLSACPEEGEFRSVSGALELSLPENDGFDARYSSLSGHFTSEFPGRGSQGVLYGQGGPRLEFATSSGDVRIARGPGAPEKTEGVS